MKNQNKRMNAKRIGFFLLLVVALAAGNVFAHDKGDLMLNIEPQIGLLIPDITIISGGVSLTDYYRGADELEIGLHAGLLGTVHYYFFDFFGVNAGLGVNLNANNIIYSHSGDSITYAFTGAYFSIPFGFRFSLSAFTVGAGLMPSIPMVADATATASGYSGYDADDGFKLDPYMGWYFDIGFDLSGIKGRKGGFGMQGRLHGPLSNPIAGTSTRGLQYKSFGYFGLSLVFQAAIELANLPIGRK